MEQGAQIQAVGAADGSLTAEDADAHTQSLRAAAELEKSFRPALGQDYWKKKKSPRYLYAAAATQDRNHAYRARQARRSRLAARELDHRLHGQGTFRAKEELPYEVDEHEFIFGRAAGRG